MDLHRRVQRLARDKARSAPLSSGVARVGKPPAFLGVGVAIIPYSRSLTTENRLPLGASPSVPNLHSLASSGGRFPREREERMDMQERVEQLHDMLEHELGQTILLDEIEKWFGSKKMRECYEAIARNWDIETEEDE